MIKYIVHTTTSETDVNGNRYHFAHVTSTKTGKSLRIDNVGGDGNAAALVRRTLGLDWSQIHSTISTERKRDWQRMAKFAKSGLYEHNVTAKMLRALNRKA